MTWQIRVAALTAIVLAGCTALVDNNSQTKIQANGETLIGNTEDGIAVFRGIPFAQPPIDDLRWRAPRPAIPRSGEQQATKFAAACIQDEYQVDWYRDLIREFAGDPKKAPQPLAISEDCLYLNIWTPALNTTANLPVMVYIYGGNNLAGWSYEPNYRGHGLAARDVVVISVGYRQGVFGTFNHPEIAAHAFTRSRSRLAVRVRTHRGRACTVARTARRVRLFDNGLVEPEEGRHDTQCWGGHRCVAQVG